MNNENIKVELTLPKELYEKIKEKSGEAGFKDINEFIIFVLEQIVEESSGEETLSPEDEEKVRERLRALGYID